MKVIIEEFVAEVDNHDNEMVFTTVYNEQWLPLRRLVCPECLYIDRFTTFEGNAESAMWRATCSDGHTWDVHVT
jgi:hypothetical protein